MIRTDIKLSYEEANLLFLEHRDTDQSIYRVGIINNSTIVWNPETNTFMDYFYDDVNDCWFNLSNIGESSAYEINRNGQVKGPRKDLTKFYDSWGYPLYKIAGGKKKLHSLIGRLFIPNIDPITKVVIDHIDRDKDNYSLTNLRWASIKENANNITRHGWTGNHLYKAFSDKNFNNKVLELTEEELYEKYKSSNMKKRIIQSKGKIAIDSFFWEVDNLDLINYLSMIGESCIDETKWVMHYSGNFKIHPLGLIDARSGVSPGSLSSSVEFHPERKYHRANDKSYRIHVLVAEVFLNDNKPLEEGLVVDHINTNSLDNRVENLRICTQSENMKNPKTLEKLSRKVIDGNGKVFNSISECAKHYNVTVAAIWARLNGKRPSNGFKYL